MAHFLPRDPWTQMMWPVVYIIHLTTFMIVQCKSPLILQLLLSISQVRDWWPSGCKCVHICIDVLWLARASWYRQPAIFTLSAALYWMMQRWQFFTSRMTETNTPSNIMHNWAYAKNHLSAYLHWRHFPLLSTPFWSVTSTLTLYSRCLSSFSVSYISLSVSPSLIHRRSNLLLPLSFPHILHSIYITACSTSLQVNL